MAKYLDENGLRRLWEKVNAKLDPFTRETLKIKISGVSLAADSYLPIIVTVDGKATEYKWGGEY